MYKIFFKAFLAGLFIFMMVTAFATGTSLGVLGVAYFKGYQVNMELILRAAILSCAAGLLVCLFWFIWLLAMAIKLVVIYIKGKIKSNEV